MEAVARAVAPGATFAFKSASQSGIPICSKPSIALSPIPLLGVLIIRRNEISSYGFAKTLRYARKSRTSLRS